jgi:hypothetical protein
MTDTTSEALLAAETECPETWLARRLAAGKPAEVWAPVPAWYYEQLGLPVPAIPHQVSDQGRIRNAKGAILSDRPNGRPKELPPEEQYRIINLCTGGERKTVAVSHVVLAGLCPEDRAGRDSRHLGKGDANRTWNWYPEGVIPGTRQENAFDKPPEVRSAAAAAARAAQTEQGTAKPPRPTFQCRNWVRCGGMVANEGSRCAACVMQTGKDATLLLNLRMPSQAVGEFFGYTDGRRVHHLAVEHGGYEGDAAEARIQRPTLWQRVRLMQVKHRIRHRERITMSSRLRNVTASGPAPVTISDTRSRTPVTCATYVTGEEGKPGRGLDAVGGCFPRLRHLSQSVTTTESGLAPANEGSHGL